MVMEAEQAFTREGDHWLFEGKRYRDLTYEEYRRMVLESGDSLGYSNLGKLIPFFCGKWNLEVTDALIRKGTVRFNELLRLVPSITKTSLTASLRELESMGVVKRIQYNEVPVRVEYSLTEVGLSLLRVFYEMTRWGDQIEYDEPEPNGTVAFAATPEP